ncbi:MAG: glycosyltransferase family 2 protein, partial [Muribaculaceae bacterium]|nr:glycosyltransferase family 2 protein [Muribaculaceae bacterium]
MVSIIVPVYNAEKYLQEAIDSVFMQAYTDWELILVNDGSTDSSMKICEKAARKTSRVKIFHTPNQGVSAARNTGLKYARGNHITFLDADDVLPMSSLSLMMDCAKTSNADIVCGKIKEIATEHSLLTTSYFYRDLNTRFYRVSSYTSIKGVRKMLYQSRIDNSVCGKLYKASLWKDIRFPTDTRYEDLAVAPLLFINADKIKVMRKTTYIYRQQPESYVHTFTLQRSDVLTVT